MFKNYFKIIIRRIIRQKEYSLINIAGLAVGMACCVLILLWVQDEFSYDRYHEKNDQIFRICQDADFGRFKIRTPIMMYPAGPALVREYPEVIDAARIMSIGQVAVKYEDKIFFEKKIFMADKSTFSVFTFPMIKGNPETALLAPYTVVITEDIARKYFGDKDPLGQTLKLINDGDYVVTGVIKNIPRNSHFTFDMLTSLQTRYSIDAQEMNSWENMGLYTYLLLQEGCDYKALETKFPSLIDEHLGARLKEFNGSTEFFLQPLERIHLYSDLQHELSGQGSIKFVYLMGALALAVLLIASINFVNLATAHSTIRAKEIGIKKALGAGRIKLVRECLGETVFLSFLAIIMAIILMELALPFFNALMERELSLSVLERPLNILFLGGLALVVGLFSGIYPAIVLSSFQPVRVLRSFVGAGGAKSNLRNILTVFQFTLSIVFVIGTIIIYQQLDYTKNKNLGFKDEHVIVFPETNESIRQSLDSFMKELSNVPGVLSIAASSNVPGKSIMMGKYYPEGFSIDEDQKMHFLDADYNFIPTIGMELVAGRNFSADLAADNANSVIINETAVKEFGWDNGLGKTIRQVNRTTDGEMSVTRTVIGVVKDFHQTSLYHKIEPQLIGNRPDQLYIVMAKIDADNMANTLSLLEKKWSGLAPEQPFNFYFLDESFGSLYGSDERLGRIASFFTVLAIIVACLGLFGMSVYSSQRRAKEIGIRKVLGATTMGIMGLLTKQFLALIVIANVIAWPMAYYAMDSWLGNFAYRIDISWVNFVLSAIIALMIALLTIAYQAIKAARVNPVETLRYE